MKPVRIFPIVEGHGEERAIRRLLERIYFQHLGFQGHLSVERPLRRSRSKLFQPGGEVRLDELASARSLGQMPDSLPLVDSRPMKLALARPAANTSRTLLLVALALAALACGPAEEGASTATETASHRATSPPALPDALEPGSAAGMNLVLVTLDTTRADRLGSYGDASAETPHLDELAETGLRFADAVSAVPMTLPSHATLFTGFDPPGHGVRANGEFRLEPEARTLAEVFQAAGFDTAAFVASFVLDPRFGLDQGFGVYDARLEAPAGPAFVQRNERTADAVTDAAIAWLEGRAGSDTPAFLWVHYFDPHDPYAPPEPWASRFRSDPYRGEIAFMDQEIGRLLAAAGRTLPGGLEGTVVVAAGDHGESLGEHGERYHSRSLYEGAMAVPLILRVPGGPTGAVDGVVVTLADLAPTLADLFAVGAGTFEETDGRSWVGEGALAALAGRTVYMETLATYLDNGWAPLHAARRHRDKYIRAPRPEYYDLLADPDESRNLLTDEGSAEGGEPGAGALAAWLAERMEGGPSASEVASRSQPDSETLARLESLGYLTAGGSRPGGDIDPDQLPDPKDELPQLDRLLTAQEALRAGRFAEAERMARQLLGRSPRDRAALQTLGEVYLLSGRYGEAEAAFRRYLEIRPDAQVSVLLAQLLTQQRRFEEAEALLDQARDLDPAHGGALIARGDLALVQGRPQEAMGLYRQAAEVDPYRAAGAARERITRLEAARRGSGSP